MTVNKNTEIGISLNEYDEILSNAGLGVWHIILKEGHEPRMQANEKMAELLGINTGIMSEEELYLSWFENILPEELASVNKSVEEMISGRFSENTYKWKHPEKGIIYVRCGGTAKKLEDGTDLLSGYHANVTDIVLEEKRHKEELEAALENLSKARITAEERNKELSEQLEIIHSIARSYNTIYYVDIDDLTFRQIGVNKKGVEQVIGGSGYAPAAFERMYDKLIMPEYVELMRKFTDLSDIRSRLMEREWISCQFMSSDGRWSEAIFIVANRKPSGEFDHVIWATRDIDEVKRKEEKLIFSSNTDELTGLFNRRAYEETIREYWANGPDENLVYVSIDINGLKNVNDNIGHAAGDELITGAAECMKACFGGYGKIFRMGGDEFSALLFADADDLRLIISELEEMTENWQGRMVDSLSLSCGYVSLGEASFESLHDIEVLADRRMYEAKSAYYRNKGVDRRGRKDAHIALCDLYTKIMKINVTHDSYKVIDILDGEISIEKGFSDSLADWLADFGKKGNVDPEDLKVYLEKTDPAYISRHFKSTTMPINIIYRRKGDKGYNTALMEIIPANDYSDDDQNLFLYVKYLY